MFHIVFLSLNRLSHVAYAGISFAAVWPPIFVIIFTDHTCNCKFTNQFFFTSITEQLSALSIVTITSACPTTFCKYGSEFVLEDTIRLRNASINQLV
jgi:hypothetical protein